DQLAESRGLLEDSKKLFEEKEFATSAFLSRYVRTGMVVLVQEQENEGINMVPWALFALLFLIFGVYWVRFKKTGEKPIEKKRVPRKVFS
ncbi:MAG: hypothetical protein KAS30_00760, partial [Candidatus Diapherotrites archaeon]|nr:hypothetical protein [Candidatus Diapherotrites archaeon]